MLGFYKLSHLSKVYFIHSIRDTYSPGHLGGSFPLLPYKPSWNWYSSQVNFGFFVILWVIDSVIIIGLERKHHTIPPVIARKIDRVVESQKSIYSHDFPLKCVTTRRDESCSPIGRVKPILHDRLRIVILAGMI